MGHTVTFKKFKMNLFGEAIYAQMRVESMKSRRNRDVFAGEIAAGEGEKLGENVISEGGEKKSKKRRTQSGSDEKEALLT
ncbi:hypothetical protein YC2023_061026 [Brassica napus]